MCLILDQDVAGLIMVARHDGVVMKQGRDPARCGNQWPKSLSDSFKEQVLSYFEAAQQVGMRLLVLLALALELPEEHFASQTMSSGSRLRLLHYPPQIGPHDEKSLGIGAHTDFECFTILAQQDDVQALQVLNKNKQWINAPPIPGTFVCNIGDTLARWTNDLFVSTQHRAINRTGVTRYSIPLFFGPSYDTLIETLPSCITTDRPLKYDPIKAGVFVEQRVAEGLKSGVKYT